MSRDAEALTAQLIYVVLTEFGISVSSRQARRQLAAILARDGADPAKVRRIAAWAEECGVSSPPLFAAKILREDWRNVLEDIEHYEGAKIQRQGVPMKERDHGETLRREDTERYVGRYETVGGQRVLIPARGIETGDSDEQPPRSTVPESGVTEPASLLPSPRVGDSQLRGVYGEPSPPERTSETGIGPLETPVPPDETESE